MSEAADRITAKMKESVQLIMFGIPKASRSEVIPPDYIPVGKLEYVLKELGFTYLAVNKQTKIQKNLVEKADRDLSKGQNFVHVDDFIKFLDKYIHKYTDTAKLVDAVKFFDMDNDGQL